jgi:hypothetical protein
MKHSIHQISIRCIYCYIRAANPFIPNDDCNTALELAREKGHVNVVRAIEVYFSLLSYFLYYDTCWNLFIFIF